MTHSSFACTTLMGSWSWNCKVKETLDKMLRHATGIYRAEHNIHNRVPMIGCWCCCRCVAFSLWVFISMLLDKNCAVGKEKQFCSTVKNTTIQQAICTLGDYGVQFCGPLHCVNYNQFMSGWNWGVTCDRVLELPRSNNIISTARLFLSCLHTSKIAHYRKDWFRNMM